MQSFAYFLLLMQTALQRIRELDALLLALCDEGVVRMHPIPSKVGAGADVGGGGGGGGSPPPPRGTVGPVEGVPRDLATAAWFAALASADAPREGGPRGRWAEASGFAFSAFSFAFAFAFAFAIAFAFALSLRSTAAAVAPFVLKSAHKRTTRFRGGQSKEERALELQYNNTAYRRR